MAEATTLQQVADKLDYEGGYDYLVYGDSFEEVTDPDFRRAVELLRSAYKILDKILPEAGVDGDEEEEEDDE